MYMKCELKSIQESIAAKSDQLLLSERLESLEGWCKKTLMSYETTIAEMEAKLKGTAL